MFITKVNLLLFCQIGTLSLVCYWRGAVEEALVKDEQYYSLTKQCVLSRYRIWKHRYIALKISWYINTLQYTKQRKYLRFSLNTQTKSRVFWFCGNTNTIIWLKTDTYVLKLYNKHSYVCNIHVNKLDILQYTIYQCIKNCIDAWPCITLLCIAIWRYINASSHL